ncbi:MAG: cytochrome c biogenesis protein CcsA [Deltaproteobacteria bacterium]|jgi:ABC-type transport system involved in cytochrome c biogenesis permease subunit|nr:cytochrome c biogenesis protein CcsA [Deltaproteobacteria bacterium]
MIWDWYGAFGPLSAVLWLSGALVLAFKKPKGALTLIWAGTIVTAIFIAGLWSSLERPPLRTMGETRLWYSLFLAAAGALAYRKWPYGWLLGFAAVLSSVFALMNFFKPEIQSKALMPALQSVYFVPHVTLYMLSYSLLAASAVASVMQLRTISKKRAPDPKLSSLIDNVVRAGLGFIMLGLITGAVWAKEAWGHYWSWDPKETWAFVTLASYLCYLHLRLDRQRARPRLTLMALPLGFVFLMITWLGLSYLPTAQISVHSYQ